ncbi:hypothetical protein M8C21_016310, partial [Ambrosia artemisiifolia]
PTTPTRHAPPTTTVKDNRCHASGHQLRNANQQSRMGRQPFVPYAKNMKIETTNTPNSLRCALQGLTDA